MTKQHNNKNTKSAAEEREPPFREGDIVKFKSGGFIMLVVDIREDEEKVTVSWRNKQGKIHEMDTVPRLIYRVKDLW